MDQTHECDICKVEFPLLKLMAYGCCTFRICRDCHSRLRNTKCPMCRTEMVLPFATGINAISAPIGTSGIYTFISGKTRPCKKITERRWAYTDTKDIINDITRIECTAS